MHRRLPREPGRGTRPRAPQSHPASWHDSQRFTWNEPLSGSVSTTHWLVCLEQQKLDPAQMKFCRVSQQISSPVPTSIPQPVWYWLQHVPPHTGPWQATGVPSPSPESAAPSAAAPSAPALVGQAASTEQLGRAPELLLQAMPLPIRRAASAPTRSVLPGSTMGTDPTADAADTLSCAACLLEAHHRTDLGQVRCGVGQTEVGDTEGLRVDG